MKLSFKNKGNQFSLLIDSDEDISLALKLVDKLYPDGGVKIHEDPVITYDKTLITKEEALKSESFKDIFETLSNKTNKTIKDISRTTGLSNGTIWRASIGYRCFENTIFRILVKGFNLDPVLSNIIALKFAYKPPGYKPKNRETKESKPKFFKSFITKKKP